MKTPTTKKPRGASLKPKDYPNVIDFWLYRAVNGVEDMKLLRHGVVPIEEMQRAMPEQFKAAEAVIGKGNRIIAFQIFVAPKAKGKKKAGKK